MNLLRSANVAREETQKRRCSLKSQTYDSKRKSEITYICAISTKEGHEDLQRLLSPQDRLILHHRSIPTLSIETQSYAHTLMQKLAFQDPPSGTRWLAAPSPAFSTESTQSQRQFRAWPFRFRHFPLAMNTRWFLQGLATLSNHIEIHRDIPSLDPKGSQVEVQISWRSEDKQLQRPACRS